MLLVEEDNASVLDVGSAFVLGAYFRVSKHACLVACYAWLLADLLSVRPVRSRTGRRLYLVGRMSRLRVSLTLSRFSLSYLNMRWCLTLGEMILLRADAIWTIRRSSCCEDLSCGRSRWLVNRVLNAASHSKTITTLTSTFQLQQILPILH
jgi:hypothetical protein